MESTEKSAMDELIEKCKSTVGYSEAENKESFMVGVSIALSLAELKYQSEINALKTLYEFHKNCDEVKETELRTIAGIINKYSPQC